MIEFDNMRDTLSNLCQEYENDPIMLAKLVELVQKTIPRLLQKVKSQQTLRVEHRKQLNVDIDAIVHSIMQEKRYYYNSRNQMYFYYNGYDYTVLEGDAVSKDLHGTINVYPLSMSLKIQIRNMILKRVKKTALSTIIPESNTIQEVHKYLTLTKSESKYFLTIVGDTLLKKSNLSYYFPPSIKHFIHSISQWSYACLGSDAINHRFKFKYREPNDFADCRILYFMQCTVLTNTDFDPRILRNLVFVAIYYSTRYNSGDDFISHECNTELAKHIYQLKNKPAPDAIVHDFMQSMLQTTNTNDELTMKNMYFLWKRHCENQSIPTVSTRSQIKCHLMERFEYNVSRDVFTNVTSPYMPQITEFIRFWTESVELGDDIVYEIDEVCTMYKQWLHTHMNSSRTIRVCESFVIKILLHFFNDSVTIEENKFINGVVFKQWNKVEDITHAIMNAPINSHSMYDYYVQYCTDTDRMVASKTFFDAIVMDISIG